MRFLFSLLIFLLLTAFPLMASEDCTPVSQCTEAPFTGPFAERGCKCFGETCVDESPFHLSGVSKPSSHTEYFHGDRKKGEGTLSSYDSEEGKNQTTENFRIENQSGVLPSQAQKKIFKGTIVRKIYDEGGQEVRSDRSKWNKEHDPRYVGVRVVSTHDLYQPYKNLKEDEVVKNKDPGFIFEESLDPIGDTHLFILNRDTRMLVVNRMKPEDFIFPRGTALELKMSIQDGQKKYAVYRQCCKDPELTDCHPDYDTYRFNVLNMNDEYPEDLVASILWNPETQACHEFDARVFTGEEPAGKSLEDLLGLVALSNQTFEYDNKLYYPDGKLTLADLEFNDWGMVRFKTVGRKADIGNSGVFEQKVGQFTPNGLIYHYPGEITIGKESGRADPEGIDTFTKPDSACQFIRAANEWKKVCDEIFDGKRCTISLGDVSFITPTDARSKGHPRDSLEHRDHQNEDSLGRCFDIRPFRCDDRFAPTNFRVKDCDDGDQHTYDRNRTREFVKILRKFGATDIRMMDSAITGLDEVKSDPELETQGFPSRRIVSYVRDHNDHIHFCLKPQLPGHDGGRLKYFDNPRFQGCAEIDEEP